MLSPFYVKHIPLYQTQCYIYHHHTKLPPSISFHLGHHANLPRIRILLHPTPRKKLLKRALLPNNTRNDDLTHPTQNSKTYKLLLQEMVQLYTLAHLPQKDIDNKHRPVTPYFLAPYHKLNHQKQYSTHSRFYNTLR